MTTVKHLQIGQRVRVPETHSNKSLVNAFDGMDLWIACICARNDGSVFYRVSYEWPPEDMSDYLKEGDLIALPDEETKP